MEIITVVNADGVEKRIDKGSLAAFERAGFKPKDPSEADTGDDETVDDEVSDEDAEKQSRDRHPSSKPAPKGKGKKNTTPNGDAAS